jgi:hypothetical protein
MHESLGKGASRGKASSRLRGASRALCSEGRFLAEREVGDWGAVGSGWERSGAVGLLGFWAQAICYALGRLYTLQRESLGPLSAAFALLVGKQGLTHCRLVLAVCLRQKVKTGSMCMQVGNGSGQQQPTWFLLDLHVACP